MDNNEINSLNHTITMNERKNIVVSGVNKIDSFDNEEFIMETTLGTLLIKGAGLEIVKLDTYQGIVSIVGKINNLTYQDTTKKEKEEGFLMKLFK